MSSDSCNQIIVIGNGFDKACGLPSSYGEYFNDRFQKYEVDGKVLPSLQKAVEKEELEDIPSLWDLLFAAFHDEETPFPRWMDVESAIRNYLWPSAGVSGHSFDSAIDAWGKFFIKRTQGTYEDFLQAKKTAESGGTYHDEIHIAEAHCRDGSSKGTEVQRLQFG